MTSRSWELMMSSTSLVLLGMFAVFNVFDWRADAFSAASQPWVLGALVVAGLFSIAGMVVSGAAPGARQVPKGPTIARARRHYGHQR
ncbi:MAG: hypothetical protein ACK5JT_06465 [Hyphomicrobiaceae bacterium]